MLDFKVPLDEARIQYSMWLNLVNRGHEIVIPNVSWSYLLWEADLVSVTKARYLYEFEIKISHADFKADFTKRKHWHFKDCVRVKKPNPYGKRKLRIPNYFTYVAPVNAIPL